ncbi:MAG TPA: hypothetical protein VIK61_14260 [Acidimicrobiia bacterium]
MAVSEQACEAGFVFERDRETRFHPRLVLGVLLAGLVVVFIIENPRETKIRYLIPQVTAPLWIGLFIAALLGALAGALIARHIAAPELRRLRGQRHRPSKPPQ